MDLRLSPGCLHLVHLYFENERWGGLVKGKHTHNAATEIRPDRLFTRVKKSEERHVQCRYHHNRAEKLSVEALKA